MPHPSASGTNAPGPTAPPTTAAPRKQTAGARWSARLRVIGYQRFALGMTIALWVLMRVPQVREFLLIYRILSWPGLCELTFVGVSALAAWYAGRMAYRIDPNPDDPGTALELQLHPWLRRWLPRSYALAVPLAPAIACFQLGLHEKGWMYATLAVLAFWAVCSRRAVMRTLTRGRMTIADPATERVVTGWRGLGITERVVILSSAAAFVVIVLLSMFKPDWAASALGTTGVLFLSGSIVTVLGTVALQEAVRRQLPFTVLLLAWMVVVAFIPIGKMHPIRSADPTTPTPQEQTDTKMPDPFQQPNPVLVAAEGGGIRAAYWTALATHTLDLLTEGEFRRRVSLASGVSGGSLGLATFSQSVSAPAIAADDCTVAPIELADSPEARALNLGHCFLAEDYLGPVVLRLLWHDMPRLIAPMPFFTDRGEALEDGWSRQWKRLSGRTDFDAALSSLDTRHTIWVFNTTHVQSGRRVIQAAPWIPALQDLAPAAMDGRTVVGTDLQLKQAVHNSSRFTYVSPTGAVDRDGSILQLVDGGYFENSGLTLVNDWLLYDRENREAAAASAGTPDPFDADAKAQSSIAPPPIKGLSLKARQAQPLVLLLSNDPTVAPPPTHCTVDTDTPDGRFENEIAAPIDTLMQVRSARGAYAREQTRRLVGSDHYFQLALHASDSDITVPLGWALSEESILEMQRQMWCEPVGCEYSNAGRMVELVERLGRERKRVQRVLSGLCSSVQGEG